MHLHGEPKLPPPFGTSTPRQPHRWRVGPRRLRRAFRPRPPSTGATRRSGGALRAKGDPHGGPGRIPGRPRRRERHGELGRLALRHLRGGRLDATWQRSEQGDGKEEKLEKLHVVVILWE